MLQENNQESLGNKALSGVYRAGGWYLRLKMISFLIGGILFLILGIILTFVIKDIKALSLSAIGVLSLLFAWLYWWRSKSLVQGRFY
jgi:hypothetical protein